MIDRQVSRHSWTDFYGTTRRASRILRAFAGALATVASLLLGVPATTLASSAYAAAFERAAAPEHPSREVVIRMRAYRGDVTAEQQLLVPGDRQVHLLDGRELRAAELTLGDSVWLQRGSHAAIEGVTGTRESASTAGKSRDRVIGTVRLSARQRVTLRWAGETLETTPEHAFFVIGRGWVPAAKLQPGDQAAGSAGAVRLERVEVREVVPFTVYNLLVERTHAYRVGRAGLLVHNGCVEETFGHLGQVTKIKGGSPPTYQVAGRENGFFKFYGAEKGKAEADLARWQQAEELGMPVPKYKMIHPQDNPRQYAVYTEAAKGEFIQLSKRGHMAKFEAEVQKMGYAARARVRRALQAAYAAGLTDTQFFLDPSNPNKPIQFIDINLPKGNRPRPSETVGELLDQMGWPRPQSN